MMFSPPQALSYTPKAILVLSIFDSYYLRDIFRSLDSY